MSVYIVKYVIYRKVIHEFCFRMLKRGVAKYLSQKRGIGSDRIDNYCIR